MPERYHIHVAAMPGRFHRVGKFGSVDWREDCSRCTNCVKLRCQYDVYKKEGIHNRDAAAPTQPLYECKACFSCVQGCTKGLLSLAINPEYLAMGDAYWTPDLIAATWNQADAGKIPVSGAGYRGRFCGPGFDSIWTDMSEIVRPTRDGIHGREYISTMVEIGEKPLRLDFSPAGAMLTSEAALVEIPMPAILDLPPWPMAGSDLDRARLAAAKALKVLAVAAPERVAAAPEDQMPYAVPVVGADAVARWADVLKQVRMVEVEDGPDVLAAAEKVRAVNPELLVGGRLDLTPGVAERVIDLAARGLKVFHLGADLHGRQKGAERPRHIKDALREVHGRLVSAGIRDEVTLIIAGGIGLPEHMAKAIICGADLVAVDVPLLVALGCRVCRGAHTEDGVDDSTATQMRVAVPPGEEEHAKANDGAGMPPGHCPAEIENADVPYAAQRMVNLMGAWHAQLIEVLGAMGIREVRRLRGEVGRAMFLEDIEREAFGDLVRK
jgi:ferredoxin